MDFLIYLGITYVFSLLIVQFVLLIYLVRFLAVLTDYFNRQ